MAADSCRSCDPGLGLTTTSGWIPSFSIVGLPGVSQRRVVMRSADPSASVTSSCSEPFPNVVVPTTRAPVLAQGAG